MRYTEQLVCSLNYHWKVMWECWNILTNRKVVIILFCAFLFGWFTPKMIWAMAVRNNMKMYLQYETFPNPMKNIFIPPAWHWILHAMATSPQYEQFAYALTGTLIVVILRNYLAPKEREEQR